MTLNVTANEIQIKNAQGQTKFTSNNKLIWEKYYTTGSIYIPFSAANQGAYSINLDSDQWASMGGYGTNDFALITIKITSSNGASQVTSGLLNKDIPANGTIIVDFIGQALNQQAAGTTQLLCVDLAESFLNFRVVKFDYNQNIQYGTINMTIQYKVRIWSYL
jgi:hypothetical protein